MKNFQKGVLMGGSFLLVPNILSRDNTSTVYKPVARFSYSACASPSMSKNS